MSNPEKLPKIMSADEYLLLEETSSIKHEYLNGRIYAIAAENISHGAITVNILTILHNQLKGTGCRVYGSNLKIRVDAINSFFYPDVLVDCGAFQKDDVFTKTPTLIFEVLSQSTATTDRREKLFAYMEIPSLTTYVLVGQKNKSVDVYRKQNQNDWTVEKLGERDRFDVELDGGKTVSLSVDEIYEDIDVDPAPSLQVQENREVYTY